MKEFSERRFVQKSEQHVERKCLRLPPKVAPSSPTLAMQSEEIAGRLGQINLDLAEIKAQLELARSLLKASRK